MPKKKAKRTKTPLSKFTRSVLNIARTQTGRKPVKKTQRMGSYQKKQTAVKRVKRAGTYKKKKK